MAKSNQKPGGKNSLPLKIPDISSLSAPVRSFLAFLLILLLILLVITAGIYFLYLFFYQFGVATFSTQNFEEARNIALSMAALAGAPFIGWRVWTAHRQANIAEENRRITEASHHADLFTKAVEQLASDKDVRVKDEDGTWEHKTVANIEVRLGGIYALERLSHVSEAFHWPIMEVLTAYVRGNSQALTAENTEPEETEATESPSIGIDIQTIMTVIERRRPEDIGHSEALRRRIDLRGAYLQGAILHEVNLRKANLTEANLTKAKMFKANLTEADLTKTNLTGATLDNALLTGAKLTGAKLNGAKLNGANLGDADLTDANLSEAFLTRANLNGANLTRTILLDATLDNTHLAGADLIGADLAIAVLTKANLTGANLNGANLNNATLTNADLTNADLTGANISQNQLDSASGSQKTILPNGLTHPPLWWEK